jgi:hypothetical protein
MQDIPYFVVRAPDAIQLNPALNCDGHANRKHEQNGVHKYPPLLEERHY